MAGKREWTQADQECWEAQWATERAYWQQRKAELHNTSEPWPATYYERLCAAAAERASN